VVNNNSALENAYLNLKNAMGIIGSGKDFTVNDVAATALVPVPDFETGFETIQKLNPSVLAKQRQITNAEFSEKITKGARMPNISASANYSGNAEDLETLSGEWDENWRRNISLSISIPIYTGNTLSTRIQQARLNVQKQESEYLTQLQDLSVQLHGILDRLNNYQEVIPINETVLSSAEEDLKLAQKRYSLGSTTILEVLDAQVSVVSARSSLIRMKYDAFIEQANLKGLLGTLDSELE
jgi:outer membrane protein TolC